MTSGLLELLHLARAVFLWSLILCSVLYQIYYRLLFVNCVSMVENLCLISTMFLHLFQFFLYRLNLPFSTSTSLFESTFGRKWHFVWKVGLATSVIGYIRAFLCFSLLSIPHLAAEFYILMSLIDVHYVLLLNLISSSVLQPVQCGTT